MAAGTFTRLNGRAQMRKVSSLLGLTLVALASPAHAQDAAFVVLLFVLFVLAPLATEASAPASDVSAPHGKWTVGLSALPMALGRFISTPGGMRSDQQAAFAYGGSLNINYDVLPGLSVGLAPQYIYNVKVKEESGDAAKEFDGLLRIAYTHTVTEGIGFFVEALPGYSIILPPAGSKPAGLVVAFGAGLNIDMSEHAFANFGAGYQLGFQNVSTDAGTSATRTKNKRETNGNSVRF